MEKTFAIKKLPLFDELIFRIDENIKVISEKLDTGEEMSIVLFIKREIEPCLKDIKSYSKEIEELINIYTEKQENNGEGFYNERKKFDESVDKMNKAIVAYVDKLQPIAQNMFPHYFDKQVTDGVDQSIYIGASMTENQKYDNLYLKNLRLWQLITMYNIARKCYVIKNELEIPLETTHLIVVQDMPITIKFDRDEKRFKVDGAYNIRYEIMKKRIDKAEIKGTNERVTRPNAIVIVYSQITEEREYKEYIKYLIAKGYVDEKVEYHELEELQGISGLKAIRLDVKIGKEIVEINKELDEIFNKY